ncbi:13109_t:CDS:2 [Dentiscutata erythropus]|uniref:13109_t:CDS:1 n=1 Tax=Dentiscutata erythropus TaxID=1348616 RepID=A0A9N9DRF0_9GLOM|nr:13109_t:CDS:2 [Dentiscutata erythropus]
MPNVTVSNSQIETSSNAPSSAKSKKNKRKSIAVTTSKDASPSRQEQLSPTTPALDTAEASIENVNKNPYIEVVNKRIRTLRKKMARIEKCEEIIRSSPDGKSQLNNDQLQSYERKGEVAGALKECEDILKQIENIDKEDTKNQKILKEQQDEREKATTNAVDEVKTTYSRSIICLLQFFRLVHFQQVGIVQLSQAESEAVETFRAKLTNIVDEVKDDVSELRIQETLDNINKLHHGDESTIIEPMTNGANDASYKLGVPSHGITYSHIRSLILSPPIIDSVDIQTEQEESYETREVVNAQVEGPSHFDENLGDTYTIPVGGLQFMLPRGEPSSQDIIDHNHTSYSYPNTDPYMVEQQQQQYSVEHQHITEHQPEQTDQQQVSIKNKEEPLAQQQELNQISDTSTNVQQQVLQQNDTSPPAHSNNYKGNHRVNHRNNRGSGYRTQGGQDSRRDSGGYRDGGHRDGGYRGGRGYSNSGSRSGRGGGNGYQGYRDRGGNQGNQYKRSQGN